RRPPGDPLPHLPQPEGHGPMTATTAVASGRRKSPFSLGRTLRYAALFFGLIIVLIPVYVLFVTSFKTGASATASQAWFLPKEWTVENWKLAWSALAPSLWRTVQMVIPAAVIAAFLGSINGFVLSRWKFPGANLVF